MAGAAPAVAATLLLLAGACAQPVRAPAPPPPTPVRIEPRVRPVPPSLAALQGPNPLNRFGHIPPERGLSQSVVTDMLQDDQGFVWLATQDGLNRYDGATFKVFKDDPTNPHGLRGNVVSSVDKAPDGSLWIGTSDGGLNRYDPRTGRFSYFANDPADPASMSENSVTSVDVDASGFVWAGTNNRGLNRLDPRTGVVTRYPGEGQNPQALASDTITAVLADAAGRVWVGTLGGGLNCLDPASGTVVRYQSRPDDPNTISSNDIQSIAVDGRGTVWAGTFVAGLNRLDPGSDRFKRYASAPDRSGSLSQNSVSSIFEDSADRLWVGTQGGGLNLLDRRTGEFTHYRANPSQPDGLANDSVMSIFEDRSGMLWFGTFGAGADTYDPYRNKFALVRAEPGNANSLSSNALWSILEAPQGVLWIGTNDGGLNRFDATTQTWSRYVNDPSDPRSPSSNTIYVVYRDRRGAMWLGTPNGLDRFDPESGKATRYPTPLVLDIHEDTAGNFWLATAVGLSLFDRELGTITRTHRNDPDNPASMSADSVSVIHEDARGRLWLGMMNGGLNLFDRERGQFARFSKDPNRPGTISSNTVLAIHESGDGVLWLGTTGGLNRFDPQSKTFTAFREKDGLPNDTVYGILEDDRGALWLSTNKGLSRFDPALRTFKNYDRSDGLQANEFNQWSFYKNGEGVLMFGGVNGLNAFHPDLLRDNPYLPPVVVTGFNIRQQPVPVGDGSPLKQPIEASTAIDLNYTDDFFGFDYAALHFSAPDEIKYAYMMDGLDAGWNVVGNRRFASYTNVPPGNYVLRVKATNSDGLWNEQGASLAITIPPPFWQTTWFRVLAAVALLGGVCGVFILRIRAIEGQRRELERQVDNRTHELRETMTALERAKEAAEAASRAKSTFLANMSHEFRTPLNAILGFTQIMSRDRRLPSECREDVDMIHLSGEHLLGLINDVLEMSKIEAGRTTLSLRAFDLRRMLEGLEAMFAVRAEKKGIALEMRLDQAVPRYVRGDEGKLRQVLMNLLGNAVKFTQSGGVTLRVTALAGLGVGFAVEDTGPGIAANEIERLFEPFVQTRSGQESQEGTGLGLAISRQFVRLMGGEIRVQSTPGVGSTFWFELHLEAAGAGDLDKPPPSRRVIGLQPGQPTYRVLVVDDQDVNRRILVKLFRPIGFDVREAADGRQALDVWETWQPQLIWMDMRMPVMDGYEATRRIKATTRGMGTTIIALTASALEEDRAVILSEGCDDYVRKPFREDELFEKAARYLGVQYVYEALDQSAPGSRVPAEGRSDEAQALASQLRGTEAAWLAELEHAAILGDIDALRRSAAQIEPSRPDLAAAIDRLAERFEHDRLLNAIQAVRSHNELPDTQIA